MDRRLKSPVLTLALLLTLGALATGCGGGAATNAPATAQTSEPAAAESSQDASNAPSNPADAEPRAAAESPSAVAVPPPAAAPATSRPATPPAHANGAAHAYGAAPTQAGDVARPSEPAKQAPVVKTIPAGTTMSLSLQEEVSSQTSQVGQAIHARVVDPMVADGAVVVPAGATLEGTVTEAVPQKKIGGTSKLTIAFDTLRMQSGETIPMAATFAFVGKSQTGKDAATIGGSAAGGALLGKILGGKSKDAAIGAVVGGAVGTAVAAKNKGDVLELPAGSVLNVTLETPVDITIRK